MDEYKSAINRLRRDIEKNTGEIRGLLRKLGEHVSYQEAASLGSSEMRELHERITELRRQLPESRQQVKKILQTVAGNEELERQINDRKIEIAEYARKNDEICENIGRIAYRAYRSLESPAEEYDELFQPIIRHERELTELEAEHEKLQTQGREGKLFKIFRVTGRSIYVKGLLSHKRRALAGLYHEVGKRFCESRLTEDLKYGGLQEALAPYYANQKKISALQSDMGKLRKDQEAKWSQLKTLGAHRFHQKRVREIETDIQRIEGQLEDAFEDLGTQHRAMPLTDSQDAEAAGIVDRIREIERVNRRKNKRIDRLNAALGIEFVDRQLGGLAHRIAKLEGDMEARRREIETLRTQASEGEKELQRLRRVRGSKQSLLEDIDDQERGEKS